MDHQTRLLSILIIVTGLVAGYAVYSGSSEGQSGIPPLKIDSKDTLIQFKDTSFNFGILESPDMKSLRKFGEAPVLLGTTGKNDIFAPF